MSSNVVEILSHISPEVIIATSLLLFITTLYFLLKDVQSDKGQSFTGKVAEKDGIHVEHEAPITTKLRNVFDVKQKNPLRQASTGPVGKPFGSSYYYAHNDSSRIGGYKDGLKMEDYVMNGPKLLSRNGMKVDEESKVADEIEVNSDDDQATIVKTVEIRSSAQSATTKREGNSVPLSKYLWDDDGNKEGTAKILIESLPGKKSTDSIISWEGQGISKEDVMANLVGGNNEGLLVQVRLTVKGVESRYHLFIPQLYNQVREVKTIVKKKRLVVKLFKKKAGNAWPQLTSTAVQSSTINSIDYIDEDLFKQ
jgi:hypothetical protein